MTMIQNQYQAPLYFAGENKTGLFQSIRKSARYIIPAMMLSGLLPGMAAAQNRSGDIPKETTVNRAADTPWINSNSQQRLFDVKGDPLLSAEAYRQAESILNRCAADPDCGDVALVIVPKSNRGDIVGLTLDYYNQMQLGSKEGNDGVMLTIDASKFRKNEPNRFAYQPGHGVKEFFQNNENAIVNLVGEQVMSEVKQAAESWTQAGAQPHLDKAVINAANIFTTKLREYKVQVKEVARRQEEARKRAEWEASPEGRAELARQAAEAAARRKELLQILALILLMAGAVGSVAAVGIKIRNHKKRMEAAVNTAKTALNGLGSSHSVNTLNVYSKNTLAALLDGKDVSKASSADVVKAIQTVWNGIKEKGEDKAVEESFALLLGQGMVHPMPEVRRKSAVTLVGDGVDRNEFTTFVTMLSAETDDETINILLKPMLESATKEDAATFAKPEYLSSAENGVRQLSVGVLNKFLEPETAGVFFKALETETDATLQKAMQQSIANLAKAHPSVADSLEVQLAEGKSFTLRQTALNAYAGLGQEKYFDALLKAYNENQDTRLNTAFETALKATANKTHLPRLHAVLADAASTLKMETMALSLLEAQPVAENVSPLLGYLRRSDTRLPDRAIALVSASATVADRPALLAEVKNYQDNNKDKEPVLAAVAALKKLANADDLKVLMAAMEKTGDTALDAALHEAAEASGQSPENFALLSERVIKGADSGARQSAALVLDNYGTQAINPLLSALTASTGSTASAEVDTLGKALLKVSKGQGAYSQLTGPAVSHNPRLRGASEKALVQIIEGWEQSASYDDAATKKIIQDLAKLDNAAVQARAKQTYLALVRQKAREVEELGRTGAFSSSNYSTLKGLRDSSSVEDDIKTAASKAYDRLKAREQEYEEEQERIRKRRAAEAAAAAAKASADAAARAAAARRRASSSSSSSSYRSSSSGFRSSSRGGFSSGGGRGW